MSTMQTAMKMALIRTHEVIPGPRTWAIHRRMRFAPPDPNVHDATGPRNLEHLLW